GAAQGADKDKQESRVATVGERLKAVRTSKGLSLDQLATELRIEARQLAALERNDFAQIGVPVFIKGYLKQYGLRLGLDPAELIAAYQAQDEAHDVEILPSKTIRIRDERQITFWVVAALVLVVLVALLAYWWIKEPMLTTAAPPLGPASPWAAMAAAVASPGAADSTVS